MGIQPGWVYAAVVGGVFEVPGKRKQYRTEVPSVPSESKGFTDFSRQSSISVSSVGEPEDYCEMPSDILLGPDWPEVRSRGSEVDVLPPVVYHDQN